MPLHAWKFIIPLDDIRIGKDGLQYHGYMATCIASTQEEALHMLKGWGNVRGFDTEWLDVATVECHLITAGAVLGWSQI